MKRSKPYTVKDLSKFSNCYTFAKVLESNPDLCKQVIERLLGIQIKHIEMINSEETIARINEKSVRCDVLAYNSDAYFEVEMQTTIERNLRHRIHYYDAMITTLASEKGMPYANITPRVLIFICTYDPFCRGLSHYPFSTTCDRHPDITLDTGTSIHVFNAYTLEPDLSQDLENLLAYVQNGKVAANDSLVNDLNSAVDKAIRDEDWVKLVNRYDFDIINAEQRGIDIGRAEGVDIGRAEGVDIGRIDAIESLVTQGLLTRNQGDEQIAKIRQESLQEK